MLKVDTQLNYPLLKIVGEAGDDGQHSVGRPSLQHRANLRPELQGLRGVAIIAVLLFHTWGSIFQSGYLGVDVFFVISGYLMCSILSRKITLEYNDVGSFYFRRIKRIVPNYLFVVGLTVLVVPYYVSPYGYRQLVGEALSSIFFYSNFPSIHAFEYFDLRSKAYFLLHTWSLSVEMQFYLIVPFIFCIGQKLRRKSLIFISSVLLAFASFMRQTLAAENSKHTILDGRIWQFLGGFAAHFLYEPCSAHNEILRSSWVSAAIRWRKWMDVLIAGALSLLLLIALNLNEQLVRLLVISLTVLYISLPSNEQSVFSNSVLVSLGDASYSIYLIHWPIFVLNRSIDWELYNRQDEPSHVVGIYLITISVIFGYILETVWIKSSKFLNSFKSLLCLLLLFYTIIGCVLLNISQKSVGVDLSEWKPPENFAEKLNNRTLELWENRHHPTPLSVEEAFHYNNDALLYGIKNMGCPKHSTTLPTKHKFEGLSKQYICNEKGNGTKNIVIFGNSHSYMTYFGVRHHFLDLAANISMFSMDGCVPAPREYQERHTDGLHRQICEQYTNSTVEMLRKWDYPIDIIIVMFGFELDAAPVVSWETDPLFRFMQNYFEKLSNIAIEVVFVPSMSPYFTEQPLHSAASKYVNGETIGELGDTYEKQLQYFANFRHRLEHISCPKCILMNWLSLWCNGIANFCHSADPISHALYFVDRHHHSLLGSMFVGQYLRQHYDDFAINGNKSK